MKKVSAHFGLLGILMLLTPIALFAQNPADPPTCCPRGPEIADPGQTVQQPAKGRIIITTALLQAQGITKSEFVGRIGMTMFAGKAVDLLVSVKSTVRQARYELLAGDAMPGLVSVQETRVYRAPLYSMAPEQLEAMEQLTLTDGVAELTIKFVKNDSTSGVALE